jgi:hypothetical protein
MRRVLFVVLVFWALPVTAVNVRTGAGRPSLEGWCLLGWGAGSIIGHGGLTDQGLLLSAAQVPPAPAYEINLKLLPHKALLFLFQSPGPAGKLLVFADNEPIFTASIPGPGPWWMQISDLPSAGILRIELGPYCNALLIEGIYGPCKAPPAAVKVRTGTGKPSLEGWCELGWGGGCVIGQGNLTDKGLELRSLQDPPGTAYELNLKLIPHKTLLFLLESPELGGKIRIYLDCQLISTQIVPTSGPWWLELSDLPDSGMLRIELGPCCESLLIRGIYGKCVECPSPFPWLLGGLLVGALLVWLALR